MTAVNIVILINLLLFECTNGSLTCNRKHWLWENESAKTDIAEQLINAEEQTGIEADFLANRIMFESTFRPDAKGKIGEVGYLQTHGKSSLFCSDRGVEPGSILCGAMLFQEGKRLCGDGFETWYATGRCKSSNPGWIKRLNFRRWFTKNKIEKWKEILKEQGK